MKRPLLMLLSTLSLNPSLLSADVLVWPKNHSTDVLVWPKQPSVAKNDGVQILGSHGMTYRIGISLTEYPPMTVLGTMEGSAASEAGIKKGDRILAVNNIKVSKVQSLQAIVSAAGAQELKLTIKRDGENLRIKVTPKMVKPVFEDVHPDVDFEQLRGGMNEDARVELKPLAVENVQLELHATTPKKHHGASAPMEHHHDEHSQGGARTERLLSEILGELKKMNQREESPRHPDIQRYTPARPKTATPPRAFPFPQNRAHKENAATRSSTTKRRVLLPSKNSSKEVNPGLLKRPEEQEHEAAKESPRAQPSVEDPPEDPPGN